jgi:dihydroxyacetone kinase-like predicted kinase
VTELVRPGTTARPDGSPAAHRGRRADDDGDDGGGHGQVALVAAAAGPGLARLFAECSAHVVSTGPGRRPTASELLEVVRATGASSVVLLPNDPDTLVVAQAAASAARDVGVRVAVLPTRAAVQGLAAIAVHDPHASSAQDLVRMTAAAAATRHGAVTVATREALTSVGWCRPGDALGIVDGDVVVVDRQLAVVTHAVTTQLLAAGGELLTVVTGAELSSDALAQVVADVVRATRRDVEISVVDGGQQGYPLLLGLE